MVDPRGAGAEELLNIISLRQSMAIHPCFIPAKLFYARCLRSFTRLVSPRGKETHVNLEEAHGLLDLAGSRLNCLEYLAICCTLRLTIRRCKGPRRHLTAAFRCKHDVAEDWEIASTSIGRVLMATRPVYFNEEWDGWADPRDVFLGALIAIGGNSVQARGNLVSSWRLTHPVFDAIRLTKSLAESMPEGLWGGRIGWVEPKSEQAILPDDLVTKAAACEAVGGALSPRHLYRLVHEKKVIKGYGSRVSESEVKGWLLNRKRRLVR